MWFLDQGGGSTIDSELQAFLSNLSECPAGGIFKSVAGIELGIWDRGIHSQSRSILAGRVRVCGVWDSGKRRDFCALWGWRRGPTVAPSVGSLHFLNESVLRNSGSMNGFCL